MGKKGVSKHLKRELAPSFWPIPRKEKVWVARPSPGPHPIRRCLPLLVLVRDVLKLCKNYREAKIIIKRGEIRVDGKARRDLGFPTGIMDVVEIPALHKVYRILPSERGLMPIKIEEEEGEFKLCRIEDKMTVKGGHIQLNLHDGGNILIRIKDPRNPEEDIYSVLDVLKVSLPEREILNHIEMKEGALALIIDGDKMGKIGKIVEIRRKKGPYPVMVTLEDEKGNRLETISDYVFAVGSGDQALIRLAEAK